MTPAQEQMIALATETIGSHGAFGEYESYERVNSEKLAKLVAMDCILQIQLKIVRNGNTPENQRSHLHIENIASRYGIDLGDEMFKFSRDVL